jgi:hypothetical protein
MGRGLEVMKRSDRDETMWLIHMCTDVMLGISLYSYFHLKLAKMPLFKFPLTNDPLNETKIDQLAKYFVVHGKRGIYLRAQDSM